MKMIGKIVSFGSLTVCLITSISCFAESGTYEQVWSILTNYSKSERGAGETVIGGSSSGTATVIRTSGGPFAEGSSDLADCIVFAKRSAASFDLEADCTTTSTSGDKIFSVARRKTGDVTAGSTGEGRSQIVGGTGRYAGINGNCTYKVDNLSANRLVTIVKCDWQK